MFRLDAELKVYLHREAVDFRKSINGLAALVEQTMGLDPFAGSAYVFRNRRCDRIKLLIYDRTGFWLLMKRLEQDRFVWPRRTQSVLALTAEQLHWLLDGIDIEAVQRHPVRQYQHVA
jgi:transposase